MQITSTEDDTLCSNNKLLKNIFSYINYRFNNLFIHGLSFIIPLRTILSVFIVLIYYYIKAAGNYELHVYLIHVQRHTMRA
jgi:hypothetical protein